MFSNFKIIRLPVFCDGDRSRSPVGQGRATAWLWRFVGWILLLEDTIMTNAIHYEALQEVKVSLKDIQKGLDNLLSGGLLRYPLMPAL
jgi:hypothetical protein